MPVTFHIDKKTGLLLRKVEGEVGPTEMIASLEASMRHPDFRPGMDSLTDMREFAQKSDSADIRQFAGFLLDQIDLVAGTRAAVVVSRTVDYGFTRMLQALVDVPGISVAVFYDIDEAEQWLRLEGQSQGAVQAGL
jgi:hypothetical protein